ncbi:hypothetical protein [Flavobacterium helocola]|uniref:Uncharacterized protein n=1 Tax=Flavobacterium helocola TaxID=3139139 RepID=A0ABU9I9J6_9FLAO
MNNFEDIENELNFSEDWFKNFKLKTPSYYHIEGYINKLHEIVKNFEAKKEVFQNDLISIRHRADILNADLAGELKSDYQKNLVRYREKWIVYYEAIDKLKKEFLDIVKKDLS